VVQSDGRPLVLAAERGPIEDLVGSLLSAWYHDTAPDEAIARRVDRLGIAGNAGYGSRRVERDLMARRPAPVRVAGQARRLMQHAARLVRRARETWPADLAADTRPLVYVNASHEGVARHPGGLDDLAGGRPLRVASYLHDIMPIEVPQFSRPDQIASFEAFLGEFVCHRTAFAVNSQATAGSLAAYLGRRTPGDAVDPEVICPGVGRAPRNASPRPIPATANFVVLGTIEPRKNHLMLLEIWRELVGEDGASAPRLLIIGRRGWESAAVADLIDGCPELAPYVTEEAELADAEVRRRLAGATALLFPSFAEGFGLPVVEAAGLGVPVIASDLPVFAEIVADGMTRLQPGDKAAWKTAIREAARQPETLRAPVLSPDLDDWPAQARRFTQFVERAWR
ncbi:MAG TPA: glycosyltransferase, partial [Hyphomicrobiales bacterium]|nr:glycosyltransferase [Hyphomicrobiales bacterium]